MLLRQRNETEFEFFSAIDILDSFSLITKEIGKKTYAIYRLMQLSVHVWLEQYG
jgi:hypothetical protein